MDRSGLDAGRIALLLAVSNLAVPPLAGYLAEHVAQAASSSEAAFWGHVCCLAFGALVSLGLGVAWLFCILIAAAPHRRFAVLVGAGLLLNGIAIYGAFSVFG